MSYTQVFGGNVIAPAQVGYTLLAISANTTLQWPVEQQIAGGNVAAPIIDLNASAANLTVQCPNAMLASPGSSITFNNIGPNTVVIEDGAGNSLVAIGSGQAWILYLASNATTAGTWRAFQMGAGTSSANAASLAGAGLQAIGSTLNQDIPVSAQATNYTVSPTDQAKVIVWEGGSGTFTLPAPGTTGASWYVSVKNLGSGTLILLPASGLIDGAATKVLNALDSAFICCDGTQYFTVGFGRSVASTFNFVQISVAGGANYTLTGSQLNQVAYRLTGALTANIQLIVPASVQQYWIDNETTGAFTLSVGTSGQGSPPMLAQGQRNIFYCDGTNVSAAVTSGVSYPISVPNGGTGLTTFTAGSVLYASGSSTLTSLPGVVNTSTLGLTIPQPIANGVALTINAFPGTAGLQLNSAAARGSGQNWLQFNDPTGIKGYLGYASGSTDVLYVYNALNAGIAFVANGTTFWQISAAGNLSNLTPPTSGYPLALQSYANHFYLTTTNASGGFGVFANSGVAVGYIGSGPATITGAALGDFGLAVAAGGVLRLGYLNGSLTALAINGTTGAVSINAPSTGTAFTANAVANNYSASFLSPNTLNQSFGPNIQAGTSSSDTALRIISASGALNYVLVFGDGGVVLGAPTGGSTDRGVGTLNAQALFVNGAAVLTVGSAITSVAGTANQVGAATVSGAVTVSLPGTVIFPGSAQTPPSVVAFNASAMAVNCALSNVFTSTFTGNVTTAPTMSTPGDGQTINWFITQDGTGSRTMIWPAAFKWPGGSAGVLSTAAGAVDLLVATYRASTGFWYASLLKAFA
jgi:hypothetical protein